MKKNELLKSKNTILRVLKVEENRVLVVDCLKNSIVKWKTDEELADFSPCSEKTLENISGIKVTNIENLTPKQKEFAHKKYSLIVGILPFIDDDTLRNIAINKVSMDNNVNPQTIKKALWLYLAFGDISVLAPKRVFTQKKLSADEKNIRWALNKYYYSSHKNTF